MTIALVAALAAIITLLVFPPRRVLTVRSVEIIRNRIAAAA